MRRDKSELLFPFGAAADGALLGKTRHRFGAILLEGAEREGSGKRGVPGGLAEVGAESVEGPQPSSKHLSLVPVPPAPAPRRRVTTVAHLDPLVAIRAPHPPSTATIPEA